MNMKSSINWFWKTTTKQGRSKILLLLLLFSQLNLHCTPYIKIESTKKLNACWDKQQNNFQIKCILRIERCYTIWYPPCLPAISTFSLHQSSKLLLISSSCLQEMQKAIILETKALTKLLRPLSTNWRRRWCNTSIDKG